MAENLYTTFWHIDGVGCTCVFEDDRGDLAMRLAMDLQRQGYPVCVIRDVVGKTDTAETIYESDDWEPPLVYEDRTESDTETEAK